MEVVKTKHSPGVLIYYLTDDSVLYVISSVKSSNRLSTFYAKTFEKVDVFDLGFHPNGLSVPCIDENCIYLPTHDGQVLGFDKYSGEILMASFLGMSIMSNIAQNADSLIVLGGLPITYKLMTDIDKYCICTISKNTGKKEFQSQIMTGQPWSIAANGNIVAIVGSEVFLYKPECGLIGQSSLVLSNLHTPIITKQYIACSSMSGGMQIFHRTHMESHGRMFIGKNLTSPILYSKDEIVWATGRVMSLIDLHEKATLQSTTVKASVTSAVVDYKTVYATDIEGNLISWNVESNEVKYLKVSMNKLRKPSVVGDMIFLASYDKMFQILK